MLFDARDLEELAAELQQDGKLEAGDDASSSSSRRRHRGHGRWPLPAHLPCELVLYELSESERQCPCCGEVRQEIGRQTSEQLTVMGSSRVPRTFGGVGMLLPIYRSVPGVRHAVACLRPTSVDTSESAEHDERGSHEL
jgi:hypothetical protein